MASRDPADLYKDKIEVSLDGRQIFYLFFGGAVIVGLVFVLGVMVGRRVEARGHVDPARTTAAADPLAALDKLEGSGLSFQGALTGGEPRSDVERKIAELEKQRKAKADKHDGKADAKAEPKVDAKPEAKADAKPEAKADAKSEAKADAKSEVKADAKSEAKADGKPVTKPEPKAEGKSEGKAEGKSEGKAEGKSEGKAEGKSEGKPDAKSKPEPKLEAKADAKGDSSGPVLKPDAKSDAKAKPAPKLDAKSDGKHTDDKKPAEHKKTDDDKVADKNKKPDGESSEAKAEAKVRFTLQLSSFQDKHEAEAFLASVKDAGYQPYITEAEVSGKGTFYRVRLGTYRSLEAANDAKSEVERTTKKSATVMRL